MLFRTVLNKTQHAECMYSFDHTLMLIESVVCTEEGQECVFSRDELIPAMWEEAMDFYSAQKMRQFQSSAAFLLCSVSLSCWVGIYLASLAFSPSFALSSRQPDTLQLNWTPANDKKSESLRASAAPLAVSSFWIKHIIPITVTIPKHSLWLTCQLITWAESSPTPSPLSLPIPPSFHLSLSLQAPFHPVPQRFGEKAQHGFEIYETRLRGGVLTDEVQTSALTSVPAGRDGSNSSWVIHVQ